MPKITKKMMNKIHNEMVRRFSPYWDRKNREISIMRSDIAALQRALRDLEAQPKHRAEEAPKVIEKKPVTDREERAWLLYLCHPASSSNHRFALSAEEREALAKIGVETVVISGEQKNAHNDTFWVCDISPTLVAQSDKREFDRKVFDIMGTRVAISGRLM